MPKFGRLVTAPRFPGPDGKPYPSLAQHALREAKALAVNIFGVLKDQPPKPFIYHMLGMMGSLGRCNGFGQFFTVRLHGFPAWFIRRTYYLSQMPGWRRRLRIMMDWTFGLLFPPDIFKVGLDSETASLLREVEFGEAATGQLESGAAPVTPALNGHSLPVAQSEAQRSESVRLEQAIA